MLKKKLKQLLVNSIQTYLLINKWWNAVQGAVKFFLFELVKWLTLKYFREKKTKQKEHLEPLNYSTFIVVLLLTFVFV